MQVISRVIGYRSMEDWKIIREVYPVETIEKIVTNLKCRYDVTFSFMAHFLELGKSEFRGDTNKQPANDFWNSEAPPWADQRSQGSFWLVALLLHCV